MTSPELKAFLETLQGDLGFSHAGWAPIEKPFSFDLYRQWINDGLHGEMTYLRDHLPLKEEPSSYYPFARSALIFAIPYLPHPRVEKKPLENLRIAAYARGNDYHHWLTDRLKKAIARLREKFPAEEFQAHTDTAPLIERDLALRAGLGWVGRNACVIHPKHGSFFLLGEILTSLPTEPGTESVPDLCGKCNRCVEACPTEAILPDRRLDARRCISYLSIESRNLPPPGLREKWGDWFFGCDVCQNVCPWNHKPFGALIPRPNFGVDDAMAFVDELRWILTTTGNQLDKAFRGTAMARAGSFGLKRNALVVAGNRRIKELRSEVDALTQHPRLGELARWTLGCFDEVTRDPASS